VLDDRDLIIRPASFCLLHLATATGRIVQKNQWQLFSWVKNNVLNAGSLGIFGLDFADKINEFVWSGWGKPYDWDCAAWIPQVAGLLRPLIWFASLCGGAAASRIRH